MKEEIELLVNVWWKDSSKDVVSFEEKLYSLLPHMKFTYTGTDRYNGKWILLY